MLSFPQSNTGVLSLLIADQKSATLQHSSSQAITLLRHAPPMHTSTATAPLPSWDEVSIWTSKAWDEVSYNPVDRAPLTVYGIVLLTVSLLSPTGCVPIDFNLTHRRRRYCGVPQPVDKVSYPPIHWPLDPT